MHTDWSSLCIWFFNCDDFADSLWGFWSSEFVGQSSTPTPWSFYQLLVLMAVRAGAKSCWKMKSASLKSWSSRRKHEASGMHPNLSKCIYVCVNHSWYSLTCRVSGLFTRVSVALCPCCLVCVWLVLTARQVLSFLKWLFLNPPCFLACYLIFSLTEFSFTSLLSPL